ncbi:unnamed protein product, partial [marine sediment metagenome]
MRLILFDGPAETRAKFYPLALSRPIWELRCGMTSLVEKLIAKVGAADVACWVPDYMADAYARRTGMKVNDPGSLTGDDLLVVHGSVKAASCQAKPGGPSKVYTDDDGNVLCAWITKADLAKLKTGSLEDLLASAGKSLAAEACECPRYEYIWDLILENPGQLTEDFKAAGRS